MSAGHWPWWLGAAGLAGVTVGSCLVGRRPFGVSGIVARLVDWRGEAAAERARAAMASVDEAALEAALAAATAEAFGGLPTAEASAPAVAPASTAPAQAAPAARPPLSAHLVFLLAIVAGAALASALRGGFAPTLALPEAYARLVAPGGWGVAALGLGGLLVGLGTTLSGGCSTGHGLTGCSRLHPAGLAATATYFGAAVAVSVLLAARLG